jgi:anti-anti-sigma regulatory factor
MERTTLIRLTSQRVDEGEFLVRMDGELTAETLHQFLGVLESAQPRPHITIDLSGLRSLDAEGRGLLLGLREAGCRLVGGSMYVNHLLEEAHS